MLEKDTNAKIIIRGKGSIKENKIGRKDGQPLPGEDEPLHAYITGPTVEVVNKACQKVREIVKQGIDVPETMNDLRRNQLRELALLNGTLRENDSLNKLKIIAQAQTIVTNTIICSLCGSAGHITSDCKMKKELSQSDGGTTKTSLAELMKASPVTWAEREKMDSEYMHLMAELGQGQAPDVSKMGQTKSIVSRGGASNNSGPTPLLSIQHHHQHNQAPSNQQHNQDRYNDSPQHDEWSNSPKHYQQTENQMNQSANGVVEEVINGRKVVDMTAVKNQPYQKQSTHPYLMHGQHNMHQLQQQQHHQQQQEEDPSQNMANQAMMYSQQMNFFAQMGMPPYGMPMWPGQPAAASGYGWPQAPGSTGAAPPPPPPPPPPVNNFFS